MEEWYRAQVMEAVSPLIAKWEAAMAVKVERFLVRRMKTRWGSCTPRTRKIRLNTELVKKSAELLEYVVVHEMVAEGCELGVSESRNARAQRHAIEKISEETLKSANLALFTGRGDEGPKKGHRPIYEKWPLSKSHALDRSRLSSAFIYLP